MKPASRFPVLTPLRTRLPILIDHADAPGTDLVIAFSSIGHDPARPPSPEFVGTATGKGGTPRRALFVRDAARSWGNHPDFAPALTQALADVTARAPVRRIAAIGLSMGGYAAMVAAQVLPVDVVLAFGSQARLDPPDPRWVHWMSALPPLIWPRLPLPGPDRPFRAILFHAMQDDADTALTLPPAPGLDQVLFPGQSHSSLVPHLKSRGCLPGLLDAALQDDRRRLLRIATSAGGVRRGRGQASRPGQASPGAKPALHDRPQSRQVQGG